MSAPLRLSAILVTLSLLAGCSAVRLAYDHADTWLRWRAGNYLDVHGEQAQELDERIDAFHDWHRATALPNGRSQRRLKARWLMSTCRKP